MRICNVTADSSHEEVTIVVIGLAFLQEFVLQNKLFFFSLSHIHVPPSFSVSGGGHQFKSVQLRSTMICTQTKHPHSFLYSIGKKDIPFRLLLCGTDSREDASLTTRTNSYPTYPYNLQFLCS